MSTHRYAQRTPALEDGERYFKASRADHGTKEAIIQNNCDKYSVLAMCDVLQIARSTFYYESEGTTERRRSNRSDCGDFPQESKSLRYTKDQSQAPGTRLCRVQTSNWPNHERAGDGFRLYGSPV